MADSTNFKWLLFDFDNTLVDFSSASKASFWRSFKENNRICTTEIYEIYRKINHQVWTDFEQGKITAEALRVKRFAELFKALGETELAPAAFSRLYLENLVKESTVYEGVIPLLNQLKGKYKMSIVTNGLKEVQRPRLAKLGLTNFFDSIIVSDEIGVAKPHKGFFEVVYQSLPVAIGTPSKSEILMIGDSLNSDIQGGKNFGVSTCWIAHGKIANGSIQPDYRIETVLELLELLKVSD